MTFLLVIAVSVHLVVVALFLIFPVAMHLGVPQVNGTKACILLCKLQGVQARRERGYRGCADVEAMSRASRRASAGSHLRNIAEPILETLLRWQSLRTDRERLRISAAAVVQNWLETGRRLLAPGVEVRRGELGALSR